MRQPPILMYHWFREAGRPSSSRSPQLEITRALFERQMTTLRRRGWSAVPLREALSTRPAESRRTVALTFDDGTADFWTHARPVLASHGFRATLFVVTGHVGGESTWDRALGEPPRVLLDWDRLARLRDEGHEIGSHTRSHRVLLELDSRAARSEMVASRQDLAERLGTPPRFLAYPRGFFRDEHKRMARESGYEGACAVILRWGDLGGADRYALRRMTVKGTESMLRFRLRLLLASRVSLGSDPA
jgi:peptidoglycan/xylan/chitin deacetylase (PgdA/CDA1 family)